MNFIVPFCDPDDPRYRLGGSFQTISRDKGKVYYHDEIHSSNKIILFRKK